ncbi:hypothetical protein QNA23_10935 [Rhodococcus erythropolis]|uniref:hypothetical protein n=1 Tax=Rhodococcus erythropolis TaxID=1833 RepID=UPI0024BB4637|nr:hypothetical protein [Rhodococcus erythropolis]MDJ0403997.1 hypothetical protein [Rhodococcus erythropolis]
MPHLRPHPLAGQTVQIDIDGIGTGDFRVENWWDTIAGGSWMTADGNYAAMNYGMRAGFAGLPIDNEVVYGKFGTFGHLVHVSELPTPTEDTDLPEPHLSDGDRYALGVARNKLIEAAKNLDPTLPNTLGVSLILEDQQAAATPLKHVIEWRYTPGEGWVELQNGVVPSSEHPFPIDPTDGKRLAPWSTV